MLSMMRRTTVVFPDPEPPATPMTSGTGREEAVRGLVVSISILHIISRCFTSVLTCARPISAPVGGAAVFRQVRISAPRVVTARPAKMWVLPQPVTPCGGRRRALLRPVTGSDSVHPADCCVGGGAADSLARRGAGAHDPRSAVDARCAFHSDRAAQA